MSAPAASISRSSGNRLEARAASIRPYAALLRQQEDPGAVDEQRGTSLREIQTPRVDFGERRDQAYGCCSFQASEARYFLQQLVIRKGLRKTFDGHEPRVALQFLQREDRGGRPVDLPKPSQPNASTNARQGATLREYGSIPHGAGPPRAEIRGCVSREIDQNERDSSAGSPAGPAEAQHEPPAQDGVDSTA